MNTEAILETWRNEQDRLKKLLIIPENFDVSSVRTVAGVDMHIDDEKGSGSVAIVIVKLLRPDITRDITSDDIKITYQNKVIVTVDTPYVPGFLAFREVHHYVDLISRVPIDLRPDVIIVDGNGLLHPHGFGSACHLGVVTGIPTIGVGKNPHYFDTFTPEIVKQSSSDVTFVINRNGSTLGAAVRRSFSGKPIFVSVGHLITLEAAIEIVRMLCFYRIPEPLRLADKTSRGSPSY